MRSETVHIDCFFNYFPFGMTMAGRSGSANNEGSKFGFNGQLKDDEIAGEGNTYSAQFWEYSPRIGKRWNQDPVVKPWMSPYHAFSDNPIAKTDPNGNTDDWVKTEGSDKWEYDSGVQSEEMAKFRYGKNTQYMDDGGTYQGKQGDKSLGTVTVNNGGTQTWEGGSYQNKDINPYISMSNYINYTNKYNFASTSLNSEKFTFGDLKFIKTPADILGLSLQSSQELANR